MNNRYIIFSGNRLEISCVNFFISAVPQTSLERDFQFFLLRVTQER